MSNKKDLLKGTVSFWRATRLDGGSASMCYPYNGVDRDLLKALDEVLFERVNIAVRSTYEEGMQRVATTPAPKGQKFAIGALVKIDASTRSDAAGKLATVKHSYAHAYGGKDTSSYCLDVDGIGVLSWFQEANLSLAPYKD